MLDASSMIILCSLRIQDSHYNSKDRSFRHRNNFSTIVITMDRFNYLFSIGYAFHSSSFFFASIFFFLIIFTDLIKLSFGYFSLKYLSPTIKITDCSGPSPFGAASPYPEYHLLHNVQAFNNASKRPELILIKVHILIQVDEHHG